MEKAFFGFRVSGLGFRVSGLVTCGDAACCEEEGFFGRASCPHLQTHEKIVCFTFERESERERESNRGVCVCARARARERERAGEGGREGERESGRAEEAGILHKRS